MAKADRSGERGIAICAMWKRCNDVGVVADAFGVQRPAVWKALRKHNLMAPYKPSPKPRRPRVLAKESYREFTPVDRDPCFRCGVRADIGCEHKATT